MYKFIHIYTHIRVIARRRAPPPERCGGPPGDPGGPRGAPAAPRPQ